MLGGLVPVNRVLENEDANVVDYDQLLQGVLRQMGSGLAPAIHI
jgi:hypothetical protein